MKKQGITSGYTRSITKIHTGSYTPNNSNYLHQKPRNQDIKISGYIDIKISRGGQNESERYPPSRRGSY